MKRDRDIRMTQNSTLREFPTIKYLCILFKYYKHIYITQIENPTIFLTLTASK